MGTEIIADKFALLKTRGSNGIAFTHIVEDTMLGRRAVVKVSDKLGLLGLDYLKTVNIVREMELPGVLMPYEGGILEEESGYYLAFPEVGEPSLEDYLRMGIPLGCGEALKILEGLLRSLVSMHGAGFHHLFINTRNVFYRPRGEVTLKDPAFKAEFFYPLLELIAAPDFSYFSPEVMDGGIPGAEADLYALSKLSERLMEETHDAGDSPVEPLLRWSATRCREAGHTEGNLSAADILDELQDMVVAAGDDTSCIHAPSVGKGTEEEDGAWPEMEPAVYIAQYVKKRKRRPFIRTAIALVFLCLMACVLSLALFFQAEGEQDPAVVETEGSKAGGEVVSAAALEPDDKIKKEVVRPSGGAAVVEEVSKQEGGAEEGAPANRPAVSETHEADEIEQTAQSPPADPSPAFPIASFTVSPGEGQSPLRVYLDATSSHDPDGSIVSYVWSCGGQGSTIYHVFESNIIPAAITITLTVTDDSGHSSSTTRCVTLY